MNLAILFLQIVGKLVDLLPKAIPKIQVNPDAQRADQLLKDAEALARLPSTRRRARPSRKTP